MKTIFYLVAILTLAGCAQPTDLGTIHHVIVKDALWRTVSDTAITMPRAMTVEQVQAACDAYNAVTLDDYRRVYIDEAPTIELSPNVTVYVCNPETNNPNSVWEDILRSTLVTNIESWRASFASQVIYIDHYPPPPVLDKDVNPFAWYALYIVDDDTGLPVFEDHCGFHVDQSFDSGGLIARSDVELYWDLRLNAFNTMVGSVVTDAQNTFHPHCHVVSRQLYVVQSPLPGV